VAKLSNETFVYYLEASLKRQTVPMQHHQASTAVYAASTQAASEKCVIHLSSGTKIHSWIKVSIIAYI